ncbi:preprotein translocase subunit SecE [bacterium]|nr:preprotein translocase subunit SecE [bacterium]
MSELTIDPQSPKKLKAHSILESFVVFFNGLMDELKMVEWPKRDEVIRISSVVLGMSLILTVAIGLLDYLLSVGFMALGRLL